MQQEQQTRRQTRTQERKVHKWVTEEKVKFPECDGSTSLAVWGWLQHIGCAVPCVPAGLNADDAVKKLMEASARDDLADEYERFLNQAGDGCNTLDVLCLACPLA